MRMKFLVFLIAISGTVCTIISGPQNSTTVLGETAEFTSKTDTKKMYWFETSHVNVPLVIGFDGENELRNPDNPQKYAGFDLTSPTQGTWILSIRFVNLTNEAWYGCVDNIASRDYEEAILTVEVPPIVRCSGPTGSANYFVNGSPIEGYSYEFDCTATGAKPGADVSWYQVQVGEISHVTESIVSVGPTAQSPANKLFDTSSSLTHQLSLGMTSIICNASSEEQEVVAPVTDVCSFNVLAKKTSISGTTAISTFKMTPTSATTNVPEYGRINVGRVIGVSIIGIIFMGIIIILVVFLVKRSRQNDENTQGIGLVTRAQENETKGNPTYADLFHDKTTEKTASRSDFSEIPFQNIDLRSILGGKGAMEYWKATLLGSTTGNSVVVKKVSDEAPHKLAAYHLKELETRQGFSSNRNVAEIIGFCSIEASKYIILEFCDNGTLKSFLLDSYDSKKVHKYGNMKKSFHVTAVGSPDKLPQFAQNVIDGMTFLVENKCLHPGLAAKKVLLDSNLVCKLYDFVPEAIAKERQRIIWGKEKMPYQWLAPEVLFLNDYSTAGDVWSLGIVLWEIFSFGMDPHKRKSQVEVEKILRDQEQLQMPTNCPGGMYQVMLDCWNQNSKERPTFHRLQEMFVQFSSEGVYVEI